MRRAHDILLAAGLALGVLLAAGPPPAGGDASRPPPAAERDDPDQGAELLGRPAPAWTFERWAHGGPHTPGSLRGKVVLLRWWTDGCRFCTETLPALETLRRGAAGGDLVVIGVYHPKPPRRVGDARVRAAARRLGFHGPLAVDERWSTLERYWLAARPERSWTSVSFLIDREGVIRWVHGGGEYHPGDDPRHRRCQLEHRALEEALAAALAAPAR